MRRKEPQPYDAVLMSVGRTPNGKKIGADKAGVAVTDRGFIPVDNQMRTNVPHIFAIGDIVGQPMLAHKATHEGHVAAEAAAGEKSVLRRARDSVGRLHRSRDRLGRPDRGRGEGEGHQGREGPLSVGRSGRAIANGRDEGFTKLLFDDATHRIVGGGIVGTHAGDLISRDRAGDRDGRRRGRHRPDDPSASDAVRIGRPRRRGVRRRVHRPAAAAEEMSASAIACAVRILGTRAMTQDEQKQAVAREAIKYVVDDAMIGVGSGSTANLFIDELAKIKHRIKGAVASSVKTAERLKGHGIYVDDLNNVSDIPVYVDGADEVTEHGAMIKGGGGALTREKIVAAVARKFVCIADASKLVGVLGKFPLPVEVIPMARSYVARQLVLLGGQPVWRMGFTTDNGNVILDVHRTCRSPIRSRWKRRSAQSSAWSPWGSSRRAEPT